MSNALSLGFSPCPNDTFIFYALVHGKIAMPAAWFSRSPFLRMWNNSISGPWPGDSMSPSCPFMPSGHVLDQYCVLSAGSALGRGCGPLLVARPEMATVHPAGKRIAIPGKLTTAALLLQMFLPDCENWWRCALIDHRCRRQTARWMAESSSTNPALPIRRRVWSACRISASGGKDRFGLPIPLGCIAARRSLGREKILAIDQAIRASVDYAFSPSRQCLPYIRSHSQEMEEEVVRSHIGLYVNDFSRDLGAEGLAAIETFLEMGRKAGALPSRRGHRGENGKGCNLRNEQKTKVRGKGQATALSKSFPPSRSSV